MEEGCELTCSSVAFELGCSWELLPCHEPMFITLPLTLRRSAVGPRRAQYVCRWASLGQAPGCCCVHVGQDLRDDMHRLTVQSRLALPASCGLARVAFHAPVLHRHALGTGGSTFGQTAASSKSGPLTGRFRLEVAIANSGQAFPKEVSSRDARAKMLQQRLPGSDSS